MREITFVWNIQHANKYPSVDKHHHRKGKMPHELLNKASKVSNHNTHDINIARKNKMQA
jgi:hypothetical protein